MENNGVVIFFCAHVRLQGISSDLNRLKGRLGTSSGRIQNLIRVIEAGDRENMQKVHYRNPLVPTHQKSFDDTCTLIWIYCRTRESYVLFTLD